MGVDSVYQKTFSLMFCTMNLQRINYSHTNDAMLWSQRWLFFRQYSYLRKYTVSMFKIFINHCIWPLTRHGHDSLVMDKTIFGTHVRYILDTTSFCAQ